LREDRNRRAADTGGFITIKAVHVWGPFIFQVALLIGGWFTLQQKVADLEHTVEGLQAQIVELRTRLYR
jgi:hypothetical protein